MKGKKENELVPFELVEPGFEAVWTGTKLKKGEKLKEGGDQEYGAGSIIGEGNYAFADEEGNVYRKWSLWSYTLDKTTWDDAIRYINQLQSRLGPLSEEVRRIRAHISSFVHCDIGFPVTVDQMLEAIGRGRLANDALTAGCWQPLCLGGTEPRHFIDRKTMAVIEKALLSYLDGQPAEKLVSEYPFAKGFIKRTYEWLGPRSELNEVQELMLRRVLLPFDAFTGRNTNREEVAKRCFGEGGEGFKLDDEIARKAGLPDLHADWETYNKNKDSITDPVKKELYRIAYRIRWGVPLECDCHHSTFRRIERWLYGIGTGKLDIPTRSKGAERRRLRQLQFSYALALDKWLMGVPMQLLLLDLGHIDLGFEPKNEIMRVYAHLGEERTPLKQWLAACLWYNFCYNIVGWGLGILNRHHREFYKETSAKGVKVDDWINSV
jgi:hypothetical protein